MKKEADDFIDEVIGGVTEKGKEILTDGMEKARSLKDKAIDELAGDIKSYVASNPWKSVGIAAGVGLIIGAILKSGKSE